MHLWCLFLYSPKHYTQVAKIKAISSDLHFRLKSQCDRSLTSSPNNNMVIHKELFSCFPHERWPWQGSGLGGKMVTLLDSLFFVFTILFLPNYSVNYYDYIVKWCSGVACNWCVSLDIALILAIKLTTNFQFWWRNILFTLFLINDLRWVLSVCSQVVFSHVLVSICTNQPAFYPLFHNHLLSYLLTSTLITFGHW